MNYEFTESYALACDKADALARFRNEFHFPQHQGKPVVYFTGNSLGLQPKRTRAYIEQELLMWEQYAVEGHFKTKRPWYAYHEELAQKAAPVAGAKPGEVVIMNQLTVNLHLMMVPFYRPDKNRFKIIFEHKSFPSDRYALDSQVKFHGFDPKKALIELMPRNGEYTLRTEDILETIERNKNELALVMMGGVNYYTGQFFDIKKITETAHKAGAVAGYDLAHAAGNVQLSLHDWKVDFACWCTYKYLNSGPGGIAGTFIHEQHAVNAYPRLAGWWGHNKQTRFKMEASFDPMPGAEGYQLSTPPVLLMAAHRASLDIFEEAGMQALREKSLRLTGYLEFIIHEINKSLRSSLHMQIITPQHPEERGCQLSVVAHGQGKSLFDALIANGMIADWREPNVIRLAPVPLYNSFHDMYRFGKFMKSLLLNEV